MAVPNSQGTTLVFDGVTVSRITNVSTGGGGVALVDSTSVNCRVFGTGASARAVLQEQTGNLSPASVEITFLGNVAFDMSDEGREGQLVMNWAGENVNTSAILVSVKKTGAVNDVIRGSLTFKLAG